MDSKQKSAT